MNIYLLTKQIVETNDRLVVISARGRGYNTYYEDYTVCSPDKVYEENNRLFEDAVNFINEMLISSKDYKIKRIDVIGDIHYLPYNEYMAKRSSGTFYNFSPFLNKGTELHNSCKALYEYIKEMKDVHITFNEWGLDKDGIIWPKHREIKKELGNLAGNGSYNNQNTLDEFMEIL